MATKSTEILLISILFMSIFLYQTGSAAPRTDKSNILENGKSVTGIPCSIIDYIFYFDHGIRDQEKQEQNDNTLPVHTGTIHDPHDDHDSRRDKKRKNDSEIEIVHGRDD